jgi:hypothetical protein
MKYQLKKSELASIIRESVRNALHESDYDEMGAARETPEEKKARLDGKKQALAKMQGKSLEELQASYLKIEAQAEVAYTEPLKHAFLWGALDQLKSMIKKAGGNLPKKPRATSW